MRAQLATVGDGAPALVTVTTPSPATVAKLTVTDSRMRDSPARADHPVAAVLMLVVATLFFASQDALTKHLVQTLAVPQIVAVRFFFFALFALTKAYVL